MDRCIIHALLECRQGLEESADDRKSCRQVNHSGKSFHFLWLLWFEWAQSIRSLQLKFWMFHAVQCTQWSDMETKVFSTVSINTPWQSPDNVSHLVWLRNNSLEIQFRFKELRSSCGWNAHQLSHSSIHSSIHLIFESDYETEMMRNQIIFGEK